MTLLNAPAFDQAKENRNKYVMIASGVAFALLLILFLLGFLLGHGWLFSNLPAEHKVSKFFTALEAKDYSTAYGLYEGDANWAQHPGNFSYAYKDFVNDWTTDPRNFYPITSHHVDVSKTDGSGFWGTGIIVAVRINGTHKLFMYYVRKDGTMSWPAPHEIGYD
jgi:hypothetical protein